MTYRPTVLFCDIDRTLLTHGHVLLPEVARAIKRASSSGLRVILASARSPVGVKGIQDALELTGPAIGFNGAWIGDPDTGTTSQNVSLSAQKAQLVARYAVDAGLPVMWYGSSVVYAPEAFAEAARRQAAVTGDDLRLVASLDQVSEAPFKLMVVTPPDRVRTYQSLLVARCDDVASIVASGPGLIEVVRKDVGKAAAIAWLAAELGFSRADCAAVGDGENDMEMLRWVGLPLTVSNGVPEARELARFTGGHCDTGGLVEVIDWLLALPKPEPQYPKPARRR
jgi:Cof subfamily protein (haloacid dehalogenase superfamily)